MRELIQDMGVKPVAYKLETRMVALASKPMFQQQQIDINISLLRRNLSES
jgi:hypothetical protein